MASTIAYTKEQKKRSIAMLVIGEVLRWSRRRFSLKQAQAVCAGVQAAPAALTEDPAAACVASTSSSYCVPGPLVPWSTPAIAAGTPHPPPQRHWGHRFLSTSTARGGSKAASATIMAGDDSQDPGLGLFGLPELRQPSDFQRMMHDARDRCEHLLSSMLADPVADVRVVQVMDDMSDTLCRCYDAAEACRNIHDDPSWRAAATAVCHELGAYIARINHHEGMYTKLSAALHAAGHPRPVIDSTTTASASGAAQGTHAIAHGPSAQQAPAPGLQGQAAVAPPPGAKPQWCAESLRVGSQLALDMEKAGIHLPAAQRSRMQALMADSNHYAAAFNRALLDARQLGSVRVRGSSMVLSPGNVATMMVNESDERTRQEVWRAASRSPTSNLALLEAMCAARHEQAQLLGAPSYSHHKAQGASLAEHPGAIVGFLQQLATQLRPVADQEMQELAQVKASIHGVDASLVSVAPWDTEYLMAHARRTRGAPVRPLPPEYSHLLRVLEGLGELMSRSMGVTLQIRPAGARESWAHGVLRCDVSHPDLGELGTVYLDLCSRPNKYPSAVTFPIRCGRQLPDGSYQLPIMALLADFGPAHCSPRDIRLTARELRVLLHEWGHCMHNLASRTRYQHLTGTRCAQDLVELPSHLFEQWASDPTSLRVLARHHNTREPLPRDACQAIGRHRRSFAGLELQQQLLLSLADQRLFGEGLVGPGGTSQAWAEATAPYSSLPFVKGSHPEARMSHLTIYGATYYSYVYARCLAAAVWDKLLARDPLAKGAGEAVLSGLLRPGGAVEPVPLVTSLLGPSALARHSAGGWSPATDKLDQLLQSLLLR